jgi:hypothetical protein
LSVAGKAKPIIPYDAQKSSNFIVALNFFSGFLPDFPALLGKTPAVSYHLERGIDCT